MKRLLWTPKCCRKGGGGGGVVIYLIYYVWYGMVWYGMVTLFIHGKSFSKDYKEIKDKI